MFGFLMANQELLSDVEKERYHGCYCGLCKILGSRHHVQARFTVTYDMVFLILMLSSLYEPKEHAGNETCLIHPIKSHSYWFNEITEYASDMSILLGYNKLLDDWNDECDPYKLFSSKLYIRSYQKITTLYPRKSNALVSGLRMLSEGEYQNIENPDYMASIFGKILGEIFVYRENDYWAETLRRFGFHLGKFIYLMDAVVDLEKDEKRGRYNSLFGLPDDGTHYKEALEMTLDEAVRLFERLPLFNDVNIMKNILCSGTWIQYVRTFYTPEKGASAANEKSI